MNLKFTDDFEFNIYGKWILAGEHAVLRGCEALVFPLRSKYLNFKYQSNDSQFSLQLVGENSADLEMIIWSVFEKALGQVGLQRSDLKGELTITSHIAFGAGMGASATLAVGISELFVKLNLLKSDVFEFAKKIEDLFHGESSGVDVAVALYGKPLLYKRGQPVQILEDVDLPELYLSHSGVRGVTKDCVSKVKNLFETNSQLAKELDLKMAESVGLFKKILSSADSQTNFRDWIRAIEISQKCFSSWGLIPAEAQKHIDFLKTNGAVACKMTGSGGGGYVLSLWKASPPKELEPLLIRI